MGLLKASVTSETSLQPTLTSDALSTTPALARSSGGLSLLFQTRAAPQSCLFIQSRRPLRKWLCLFPSVSCEPWAKYTHTTASPAPALEQHAPFSSCSLCKSNPRILSPPSLGEGTSEMEMKVVQPRMHGAGGWGGWAYQSLVSVAPTGECSRHPRITVPGQ